ncbi:hypothetical protein [Asticcacaulis benevestitus]|uniref:hypothetical protein n=1 Tax=Asticcacaulis benevestitus TaxID=347481 RepID=UPI0012DDC0E1|nr:hypothetical protein [Asticcacaulis benevestitus]
MDDEWRLSHGMLRLLDFPNTHLSAHLLVLTSIHSDDRARFKESLALMVRGITPPTQVFRILRQIRGIGQAEFHFQELADSAGRAMYVLFAREVTTEHAVSLAFADTASRLDMFMDALDVDCLWRGNLKGVSFASAGRGMLKYESADLRVNWIEHIPNEDRAALNRLVDKLIETDARFRIRVNILCADHVVRPFDLSGVPIKGPIGETAEWCGTFTRVFGPSPCGQEEAVAQILPLMTGAEVRAACGLLGWSYLDAARHSGLSKATIFRFASTEGSLHGIFKARSVAAFLLAILDHGIFLDLNDADELSLRLVRREKRAC